MTNDELTRGNRPVSFRRELIVRVLGVLMAGESCSLVGVGSSGKSNVARHLARREVLAYHLGEQSAGCLSVLVNCTHLAEYTLAAIFFALKRVWFYARAAALTGRFPPRTPPPGAYGSTVGLVSLGMVGRRVAQLLRPFDLRVIAYDPFASAADAAALGLTLASLDEVFRTADVVSLHTPKLPETLGLITGRHFAAMKTGAAFINTARGAVVREGEMIEVLTRRPDLTAVLDVTDPEPPLAGSPLYRLPNVMLTPHIAGSMGLECRRMGRYMAEELRRFVAGEPLRWRITRELAARLA